MSRYILHLFSVLLYILATEGAANNTIHLREFYRQTAYLVQNEGRRLLTNEYVNDREKYLRNKMIKNINAIDSLYLTTNADQSLCDLYEGFKLAREILESYHELKVSLQDNLYLFYSCWRSRIIMKFAATNIIYSLSNCVPLPKAALTTSTQMLPLSVQW